MVQEGGEELPRVLRAEPQQCEYLQQKTEKFHLFSSPDVPTKLRLERDRQMEKNHVKPGIFISSPGRRKGCKVL